jgi:hypothetical protein
MHRILDYSSSEGEGTASSRSQTSPESDVILSDDPPPVHQDVDADNDDGWTGSGQEMQNAGEEYRSVMTMLRKKGQAKKVPQSSLCLIVLLHHHISNFSRLSNFFLCFYILGLVCNIEVLRELFLLVIF